jgi:hypothetical protein
VAEGQVEIKLEDKQGGRVQRSIWEGQIIGEMALVDQAHVRRRLSLSRTTLSCSVSPTDFTALASRTPPSAMMMRNIARSSFKLRHRDSTEWLLRSVGETNMIYKVSYVVQGGSILGIKNEYDSLSASCSD